jgi:ABC-type phosphate transport system substrate-binding protein
MNTIKTIMAVVVSLAIAACAPKESNAPPGTSAGSSVDINGAGATFPYPIYSKWFSDYAVNHPNAGALAASRPERQRPAGGPHEGLTS